ncbi:hypothetical protein ACET3Z_001434 [Daucus carota]
MGSQLRQALKSLCFDTCWNYAVFWKFEHQAQMVLTWEDGYYENHEQPDASKKLAGYSYDGQSSRDSLGLAVAKMSLHVYSLGEGIVGKVAITGKHMWISTDKHVLDSCSLLEYSDGLLPQFSSGIRTIAVVPVVPHGVVQLGSLDIIAEDLMLVNHIKDNFLDFQASLSGHCSNIDSSSCLSSISSRTSVSRNYRHLMSNADKIVKNDKGNMWCPVVASLERPPQRSYTVPAAEVYSRKMVSTVNNDEPEYTVSGVGESSSVLPIASMDRQTQVDGQLTSEKKSDGHTTGIRGVGVVSKSEDNDTPSLSNNCNNKCNFYNTALATGNNGASMSCLPSAFQDTGTGNYCGSFGAHDFSQESRASSVKTSELKAKTNHMDTCKTCFQFTAGCELFEALGPSFKKQYTDLEWETDKTENGALVQISEGRTSSGNLLMINNGTEHLLEAVVANVCQSVSDVKCVNPKLGTAESLLTIDKLLEPCSSDNHTIGSANYSYDRSSLVEDCLAFSEVYGDKSSKGISSASPSACSEQLERPQELTKMNKKRARPGENCRPRPRDRQLIQDRIKELRELVPNGSKCSIDSLLERTIKHMLFLQCTTKHADKLQKCAESKLIDKETGVHVSSNNELGSSWAMEVESHLRVFPIMIENINLSGQMLIEMLCENCSRFFEIAEAIRSLGMTILKGSTEACGGKIWICFVAEGLNNRNVHRMDILWSLVQILQPKTDV